jgi:hypothetical protein
MEIIITESQYKKIISEDRNFKVKPGEEWFYEPKNYCLRTASPPLELDGATAKRVFPDGVSYISYEDNNKFFYFPKPENPKAYSYNNAFLNQTGVWRCNPTTNKIELKIDHEDRKRRIMAYNGISGEIPTVQSNISKAKTMEDVKSGIGYIILNMKGEHVGELQKMLLKLGYDLGPNKDDNFYGQKTKDAVVKFQKDSNIKPKNNIYGVFGKITYDALIKKLKEKGLI